MDTPPLEDLVADIIKLKYDLGIKYDKDLSEMMGWGKTRVSNLLNVDMLKSDALDLRNRMLEMKKSKNRPSCI